MNSAGREMPVTIPSLSVLTIESCQIPSPTSLGFLVSKAGESKCRSHGVVMSAYKTALALSARSNHSVGSSWLAFIGQGFVL